MKIITRIFSIMLLVLLTGLSSMFGFDPYSDPQVEIPYCPPGSDCGLQKGVDLVGSGITDINTTGTFSEAIQNIVIYFLGFITLIAVIYIIYAGFRILTSSGEEEVIKKAKSTIIYVIIGIVVIWFAWTIANFAVNLSSGGQ